MWLPAATPMARRSPRISLPGPRRMAARSSRTWASRMPTIWRRARNTGCRPASFASSNCRCCRTGARTAPSPCRRAPPAPCRRRPPTARTRTRNSTRRRAKSTKSAKTSRTSRRRSRVSGRTIRCCRRRRPVTGSRSHGRSCEQERDRPRNKRRRAGAARHCAGRLPSSAAGTRSSSTIWCGRSPTSAASSTRNGSRC